jgi:hypothetical protein
MPLSATDWGADPKALLTAWAAATADALAATGVAAASDCRPREAVAAGEAGPGAVPTLVAPARFTDRFGVTVTVGGQTVAAVLLVSPDNKADSDASLAFAVRAAALMNTGVGVVIVDAVPGPPSWATHLHSLVGVYPLPRRPRNGDAPVLVVHPRIEGGAEKYAVWHHSVPAGAPLPSVPLPVAGETRLTLDLEATYLEACRRTRPPG